MFDINKKALFFAAAVPILFAAVLIAGPTRELFLSATASHPYIMGFIKFALLATSGEIIAGKISRGFFSFPKGALLKAVVWGLIGMSMALLIPVYSGGVAAAQSAGALPFVGNKIVAAIFTSIIMNLSFGPIMMAFHRITDALIENRADGNRLSVPQAVSIIDWGGFVSFVVLKTIPFFWIPAHSITFALPGEYRVFVSAFLSMVLGTLLALAKRKK